MNFLSAGGKERFKTDDSVVFSFPVGTFTTKWLIWPVSIYSHWRSRSSTVAVSALNKQPRKTKQNNQFSQKESIRDFIWAHGASFWTLWSQSPGSVQTMMRWIKWKKKKRLDLTFATAAHSCTIVHTVIAKSMLWDRKKKRSEDYTSCDQLKNSIQNIVFLKTYKRCNKNKLTNMSTTSKASGRCRINIRCIHLINGISRLVYLRGRECPW